MELSNLTTREIHNPVFSDGRLISSGTAWLTGGVPDLITSLVFPDETTYFLRVPSGIPPELFSDVLVVLG
jgi:hypothetical protein